MGMGKVMKRIHLERNYGDADFFFKIEPVNPSNFDPKWSSLFKTDLLRISRIIRDDYIEQYYYISNNMNQTRERWEKRWT